MLQIDLKSRIAIYEQIIEQFKRLIISGLLEKNTKVPSVRELSKNLTVNPNTVQKAYRELESQGYIYTVLGQGSFIAEPPQASDTAQILALYEKLRALVQELLFRGEAKESILQHIENA